MTLLGANSHVNVIDMNVFFGSFTYMMQSPVYRLDALLVIKLSFVTLKNYSFGGAKQSKYSQPQ